MDENRESVNLFKEVDKDEFTQRSSAALEEMAGQNYHNDIVREAMGENFRLDEARNSAKTSQKGTPQGQPPAENSQLNESQIS